MKSSRGVGAGLLGPVPSPVPLILIHLYGGETSVQLADRISRGDHLRKVK